MRSTLARRCLLAASLAACSEGVDVSSGSVTLNPTTPTSAPTSAPTTVTLSGEASDSGGSEGDTSGPQTSGPATTGPMTTRGESFCGDGVRDFGEECDGEDLNGQSCQSLGYEAGVLACDPQCMLLADACYRCGDGTKDMAEACDGADLDGHTCASEGFGGGTLKCRMDCKGLDTSGCTPLASCGDGVKEGAEQCDGAQLGGQTCVGLGFDEGTLLCSATCTFDPGGCMSLMCAGQGEPCLFDPENPQSNCCPPGVKGNVLGICDIIICL